MLARGMIMKVYNSLNKKSSREVGELSRNYVVTGEKRR
jgi:hypothetical protein